MRFSTLLALVACASAASTSNVKTMAMRDQMKSLQNMVKITQSHKAGDLVTAVADRKAELEYQLALNGNDKQMVARELQYLLSLVQSVESNDFAKATQVLSTRRNKLVKYSMHLQDEVTPAETTDGATDAPADGAADGTADGAADGTTDGTATEEPKKGSKVGGIIGGVVAAGVLVGGCVYFKKKGNNDNEGGENEDRRLFKLQFKGNTVKKVQKEALVPTFAIPAEENI